MQNKDYNTVYMQFSKLRALATLKDTNGKEYDFTLDYGLRENFDINFLGAIHSLIDKLAFTGMSADFRNVFTRLLYSKYGNYYIAVNPRKIIKNYYSGASSLFEVDILNGVAVLKLKAGFVNIDGNIEKVDSSVEQADLPTTNITNSLNITAYGDCIEIMQDILQKVADAIFNANKLIAAYVAIPTVNEQFTDETTVTPNLNTENVVQFAPLNGNIASGDRNNIKQTGNQVTVTKRASGISAKEQAEIVRNLPNIFKDSIEQIGALLINPQTIQDMRDWGLTWGDYIDED